MNAKEKETLVISDAHPSEVMVRFVSNNKTKQPCLRLILFKPALILSYKIGY